ncbi:hypothetical protein AMS68_002854 [Peltaster fructicola]|uniref:Protein transport protein SEC31 n=1 Tax=Peltaster fructicola TaxID=286661 RepID=A0A6H0XRF2_9PEZI|nr:hypothetical protein AMS68_002854 [Peltaster fructicola]
MVRLREIQRTAVFAWLPGTGAPLLATGTRTGAVNDDFSSEIRVELWELGLEKLGADNEVTAVGSITVDSGFNDIAWSEPTDEYPLGVIAGALENGSIDLFDAAKLRKGDAGALISRTTKHSGAAKALQFNPHRHNLLASVGAKAEIFIYDLGNMSNPFRLGGTAARADDIECLDWNKQEKTAHILATGSSGGFVTVWDVKQKKDILTLNNQGRKAVSAVAWDPEESTKLATATPNDQEPAIFLWSLRNSAAPERILTGHELGVISLSWCVQDPELLLSCGKDNRTICWNPRTGEKLGDFAAGSNWAFQTKWNPHNPSLIASASFDGKILITSTQSTNSKPEEQASANQSLDDTDFFLKAQSQPQSISFSIAKAPRWASRPSGVSFGFGGKLVRVGLVEKKSKITIDTFEVDSTVGEAATAFEEKLENGDIAALCTAKIDGAKTEEEKADWQVIETLNAGKSRKKLREYLGFQEETLSAETEKLAINGDKTSNGDDDFFNNVADDDDAFLVKLAATKGTKVNNPFTIHTGQETAADKSITQALMLGQFEAALDICLKEDRLSDAFMIAVCGGQKCIDKAQAAYLKKKANGPTYLRLLASIVGKNLWDIVHNADIKDWKSVMATLCTYADETEFSDLCEVLGDRLEEAYEADKTKELRRDASFCYSAGSKLEKVVINWVQELEEQEKSALGEDQSETDFAIHARALQGFVEKVSVFRKVTNFSDADLQSAAGFRLAPLYRLYVEYANILAAHGKLAIAEQYLTLLPVKYEGAESAQSRVSQSTKKAAATRSTAVATRGARATPVPAFAPVAQPQQPAPSAYAPPNVTQPPYGAPTGAQAPYVPPGAAQAPYVPPGANPNSFAPRGPYAPPGTSNYTAPGYQPPHSTPYGQPNYSAFAPPAVAPPPRAGTSSPSVPPPSAARNIKDWNDMPDDFIKQRQPTPRRGTPGPTTIPAPYSGVQPLGTPAPTTGPPQFGINKPTPPLPPPPKANELPTPLMSPALAPPPNTRTHSTAANAYAPATPPVGSTLPTPAPPPVARGVSPYQPPPSTSSAAPTNRYAPAPGTAPSAAPGMPPQRNVAPNPYAAPPTNPYAPGQSHTSAPQSGYGTPQPQGPPRGPPPAAAPLPPPPKGPARAPPPSAVSTPAPPMSSEARPKYPKGDRSHIPASAQPIVDLLTPEVARIKSVAPATFKREVDDMEKRINILFDHLNNEDLLKPDTVAQLVEISQAVGAKDWERAQALFTTLLEQKKETEGGNWIVGVKRLVAIGRMTQ